MAQSAAFYRLQESLQRDRASMASLPNVKQIATTAADAWAMEASRAERIAVVQASRGVLPRDE